MRSSSFYRDASSSVSSVDLESSLGDTDYEYENSPSAETSRRTVSELYQRLDSLRSVHEFNSRRTILSKECDTYAGIRPHRSSAFDIYLMKFTSDDVLCVDIHCISHNIQQDDALDAFNMRVSLHLYSPSKGLYSLNLQPNYHCGVYSYALTTADVSNGEYQLLLSNEGDSSQNLRISYRVKRIVRAAPLEIGKTVKGKVALNHMQFYRIVAPADTSKLLTFRVQPETDAAGRFLGDPDLFVCNGHGGLVEITRESATWRSVSTGVEVVHVHPHDPLAGRGRVFIIGVAGAKETNSFTLEVTATSPPPMLHVSPDAFDELRPTEHRPAYFYVDVKPSPGFTYVFVGRDRDAVVGAIESRQLPSSAELVCTTEDPQSVAAFLGLPPKRHEQRKSATLVYASLFNMYPDADCFSWRV